MVELETRIGFALHVGDDEAEVVEELAAGALQRESVSVFVPQAQDERGGNFVFIDGAKFFDGAIA
ncbi:hypothetical protein [Mycolicibacterium vulneris]|uniref:hypothetical protein n=1 Tax=Mycolicibacterium vulneris TaxID=547163 RepID=UPI0015E8EAEA|nr:hypothetical protein [Mycolicibacterium vulneris]